MLSQFLRQFLLRLNFCVNTTWKCMWRRMTAKRQTGWWRKKRNDKKVERIWGEGMIREQFFLLRYSESWPAITINAFYSIEWLGKLGGNFFPQNHTGKEVQRQLRLHLFCSYISSLISLPSDSQSFLPLFSILICFSSPEFLLLLVCPSACRKRLLQ